MPVPYDTDLQKLIETIAADINVSPRNVWAVIRVESSGVFSYGNGKIPILLERHKVFKYSRIEHGLATTLRLSKKHPDICNLITGGYGSERSQYKRLAKAIRIFGEDVAHMATSFGAFQGMGFNHDLHGYDSAKAMSDAYHRNPKAEQVEGFISFISAQPKMLRALRKGDFHAFAKRYNGSGYRKNKYATKMIAASETWDGINTLNIA